MIFPDFDPEIFRIGPVAVRWYALAYIAGIVLGWLYVNRLVKAERIWGKRFPIATPGQVEDLVLWVTLGVILGGRLGYMLFYNTSAIWTDPLEIFRIWEGGMSFHGGLIGVTVAFFGVAKLHKVDVLKLSDLAAPAIPIGLFFGRIANFVNAELWGRETYSPLGVIFCNDGIIERLGHCPAGPEPRHPSQLYEAGLEGIVLFIVLALAAWKWDWLKRRGLVTGAFLSLYAVFRIAVETVREPDVGLEGWPLGLTMGMILSLPMLAVGLYLIARARGPKGEEIAAAAPPAPEPADAAQAIADALPDDAAEPELIASGTLVGAAAGMAPTETPVAEAESPPAAPPAKKPRPAAAKAAAPKPVAKPAAKAKPASSAAAPKAPASRAPASRAAKPAAAKPAAKPKPKPSK